MDLKRGTLWLGAAFTGALVMLDRSRRTMSLAGQVVAITGGSRGLGLVLAREMLRAGADVAICARDRKEVDRARADLEKRGPGRVLAVVADVSDEMQARRFIQQAEERFGRVDVLVNNAGVIQVGPVQAIDGRDFTEAMDAIFWHTLHCTRAALPGMRRRRSGRIVNISSIGGAVAVPHLLPYTAAKFAVTGFSMGLSTEEAKHGVRVVTVLPGLMRTGSYFHALAKGKRRGEGTWFALGASLPFLTIPPERAARRIRRAIERGEAFVVLGLPAKALRLFGALLPTATVRLLSLVDALLLPSPGEAKPGDAAEPIARHQSVVTRSPLTALGKRQARRNNELPVT